MNKEFPDFDLTDRPFHFSELPSPVSSAEQTHDAIKIISESFNSIRIQLDYLHKSKAYTELGQGKSFTKFIKQCLPDLSIRLANQLLKLNVIEKQLNLGTDLGTVPIEALKMLEKLEDADRLPIWLSANKKLIVGGSIINVLEQEIADKHCNT